jgi:hypothetical protein
VLWERIDAFEMARRGLWLTAVAGFLHRNRRVLVASCIVFVVSLAGTLMVLNDRAGGPPVDTALKGAGAGHREQYVIRDIPEPGGATDTVRTEFVTGDRDDLAEDPFETYVYEPVVTPVSVTNDPF